jgi:poly(hydroxyalkanoate) depolymerase family esterase
LRLSKTIAQLKRVRSAIPIAAPQDGEDRLADLTGFGANPGSLSARCYVPPDLEAGAPLVVVLHGCTQSAAAYDRGSGWSRLAERNGFALLFPEQQRANNPNLCFNWFEPGDTVRGKGEAASIAAMIERMTKLHGIDPSRIFVTGLSAGGAMASVMLATYPEVFAGGAIIAGIAYGCASSVGEAFGCMGGRGHADAAALGDRVRAASRHKGPWPRVSVWQGSADHTVAPANADAVAAQWLDVHGLPGQPSRSETVEGYPRQAWTGADGREVVEQYSITGLGHGTPIKPGDGEGRSGEAGPHMLRAAISSTDRIAAFWGIAEPVAGVRKPARKAEAAERKPEPRKTAPSGVQGVIEDALKAAGLMR